jgi:hypothetical protein
MAYLIPTNLGSRADVPAVVQQVATGLRDLVSEDVTVVYDAREDTPALVVIDPQAGVMLLDCVEGGASGLSGGRLLSRVRSEPSLDVLEQGLESEAAALLADLRAAKWLSRDVPVIATHAAPRVTRARAEARGLEPDALLLKEDFRPGGLRGALARLLGGRIRPLSELEERVVRAVINPEIVVADRTSTDVPAAGQLVFRAPETGGEDVLAVLDRQQQNLAMHLGDGYRVIRGVAGAGKSLVLVHRARLLAQAMPSGKVLLTCFNIVIGKALARQLADVPNVDVRHIDSLASQVCSRHGVRPALKTNEDWIRQRVEATRLLRSNNNGWHYDVVLVDEAQDFDAAALDVSYAALKPGHEHFVVALDAAQNIYRKRGRWAPPGMTARGRTTVMRVNYRNTHEILSLAYGMLSRGGEATDGHGGLDDDAEFVPPEATSRRGCEPEVVSAASWDAEVGAVCDRLERWHDDGVPWSDMLVLFGSRAQQTKLYYACRERRIPYFWVGMNHKSKSGVMDAGDVVRSSNIQIIKGLEFGHVAICGVNDIATPGDEVDSDLSRRRLLYVGMTRATDHLFITVSGHGPIGEDLLAVG